MYGLECSALNLKQGNNYESCKNDHAKDGVCGVICIGIMN